jgi:hypothetical protein
LCYYKAMRSVPYHKFSGYSEAFKTHIKEQTQLSWENLQHVKKAIDLEILASKKAFEKDRETRSETLAYSVQASKDGKPNLYGEHERIYRTIRVTRCAELGKPNPWPEDVEATQVYSSRVDQVARRLALSLERRKMGYTTSVAKRLTKLAIRYEGRDSEICAMYADGLGIRAISRAVQCSVNTVKVVLSKNVGYSKVE